MKRPELHYRTLLKNELESVEALLHEPHGRRSSDIANLIENIVQSGGKRLRPAVLLLSAHIFGAEIDQAIPLAGAVEMLHTATLIHDDLIDGARLRRGQKTINAHWPLATTVLIGDLAFAWAARLAARGQSLVMMDRFSETLGTICSGELNQLIQGRGQIPTEEAYYARIYAKTASLFVLTAEAGPRLALRSDEEIAAMQRFGQRLGEAFQITDDVLDFMGSEEVLGKPVGSDLHQGLVTLPVLRYAEAHPGDARIRAVVEGRAGDAEIRALVADLRASGVAGEAMAIAEAHVAEAVELLAPYPESPYRRALEEIAAFAVRRCF